MKSIENNVKNIEIITSKSNPKIVEAKKLLEKKYRDKTNLFLVETKKVLKEALNCGLVPKCFFVEDGKDFDFLQSVLTQNAQAFYVSSGVFKELSTVVTNDGYIGVFEKKPQNKQYLGGRFLVLDNLQNPDNFGAILRTALACDFKQIFAINCCDEYNPKVIRASMGNQFKLDIVHIDFDDISKLFSNAKLFAMSMEGKNIFDIENFDKNVGFVIGNEGNGVSKAIKDMCNQTLSIPMQNNVESLNASISASIVMYQIYAKETKKQ